VRHVSEHVSRQQQVRFAMLPPERLRERLGEELRDRRDALPPRLRGDVARGLDTEDPDRNPRERLQDGAVVAGDLHDQTVAPEAEEPHEVSVPADETATEGLDQLRQYRLTLRTRSRCSTYTRALDTMPQVHFQGLM